MDALIGKYRVHKEETVLILAHHMGLSFNLILDEALELMEFIEVYEAAIAAAQRDTEPRIERVVVDEQSSSDKEAES